MVRRREWWRRWRWRRGWGKRGRRHRLSRFVVRVWPDIHQFALIQSENRLKQFLVCWGIIVVEDMVRMVRVVMVMRMLLMLLMMVVVIIMVVRVVVMMVMMVVGEWCRIHHPFWRQYSRGRLCPPWRSRHGAGLMHEWVRWWRRRRRNMRNRYHDHDHGWGATLLQQAEGADSTQALQCGQAPQRLRVGILKRCRDVRQVQVCQGTQHSQGLPQHLCAPLQPQ
mmetsp:Transcript_4028/g.11688  ORF Transcript_4028/g.11688 Transcript_4028/m.11688 type:complete len:223 (-) Transcript_4028:1086-1754(-)